MQFDSNHWAIILGGSSGFGLSTAMKLSRHGMNLCIVHRDRRGAQKRIDPLFEEMKDSGVRVETFNVDALSDVGRTKVLDMLTDKMGQNGRVRLILHSIAFGNLKPLCAAPPSREQNEAKNALASELGISSQALNKAVEKLFSDGLSPFHSLADPPVFDGRFLLNAEDFSRTVHAMGTSLIDWVGDVFCRKLFADDARVIGLTSEGNEIAWRGYAAVSAAKAALEAAARSIGVEYGPYGIRANVIQPGVTQTPALQAIPGNQQIAAGARLRNPMGRLTCPDDVANVIALLCMDEASWINGALIRVDGGEKIA